MRRVEGVLLFVAMSLTGCHKDQLTVSTAQLFVDPSASNITRGNTKTFSVSLKKANGETVAVSGTWSLSNANLGALSAASGNQVTFTASSSATGSGTLRVTAEGLTATAEIVVSEASSSAFGVYSETFTNLVLGGSSQNGSLCRFSGGGSADPSAEDDFSDKQEGTKSLKITLNVTGGGFAGWFFARGLTCSDADLAQNSGTFEDLSAYANGRLIFFIKTPVNVEVGMRSDNVAGGSEASKVVLTDASVSGGFATDNQWHEVSIPISKFTTLDARLNLSRMKVLANFASNTTSGGTSGNSTTFRIDHVRWIQN